MILQWLVVITLFVHKSLAYNLHNDIDGNRLWRRQEPVIEPQPGRNHEECKSDIIVLWDNSASIGFTYYPKVKNFLKKLITNEDFRVGRDGTRLGFVTFADDAHTKKLLDVGEITDPAKLTDWLDNLDYKKELMGGETFTGKAFELANEMFQQPSPKNVRPDVPDVILLFTDGAPNPEFPTSKSERQKKMDQKRIADKYVSILKNKNVKIVGITGGKPAQVRKFKPYVEDWASSPDDVSESELDHLDEIVDKIVKDSSCIAPAKLPCRCENYLVEPQYIKQGSDAVVTWLPPSLKCPQGSSAVIQNTKITPEGARPGQRFQAGPHNIVYEFTYELNGNSRTQSCSVDFNVISGELCGRKIIDSETEVCCCGETHRAMPGHECCGIEYYYTSTGKCCDEKRGIVVCKEAKCPAV
ncbi:uncharacterized protein LOC114526851 [Dendronephthya gigantea]|uniref:uncharacterized protein LOC114526851 n=1 Tax=Dendronephthya gigantea TaxID=151771 RepID=UPI00106C564B|nr:uncharacterized protein LOC114526851 [Dendronephthya gigantea]